jgi:methyl-accepting chemotaxis protein
MKWFANMRISSKLFLGFAIVLVGALVMGGIGILNLQSITVNSSLMYTNMTVPIEELSQVATSFQRIRVNLRDIILASDPAKISEFEVRTNERRAEIDEKADSFSKLILSERVQDAYDEFVATRTEFTKYFDEIVDLAKANRDEEAVALLNSDACYQAEQAEQDAILNLASLKSDDAGTRAQQNNDMASMA